MLKDIISDKFFKVYHTPSSKIPGPIVEGSGNDLIAIVIGGVILLIIVVLIIYFRKKYKKKYSY